MIKSLLSSPGLISEPLKPKSKLILTELKGLSLSTPSLVIIVNLTRTDFAWAKALGYSGAAWTEADAVEVGGSTADNQIIEYQFLGGQVSDWSVSLMLNADWLSFSGQALQDGRGHSRERAKEQPGQADPLRRRHGCQPGPAW